MDNEFAKKIGREVFEKLDKQTQAVMLECFDHQKWLDTEQAKLEYIYSLAQRHSVYLKYNNGMAEDVEAKIQRAFQTLLIEGRSPSLPKAQPTAAPARNGAKDNANGAAKTNGNGKAANNALSLEDDLELSLEGL